MEFLTQYNTSSVSSSDSECIDDLETNVLTPHQIRSVYLLTYSQADLSTFPDRASFATAVTEAISKCEGPRAKLLQWTCSQESHKKQGKHYHMVIKLDKIKRWLPIRQYLLDKWNIYVHFSNRHCNYYSAWLYTTKEDHSFLQSPGHPDLTNSRPPRTLSASEARVKRVRANTHLLTASSSDEEEGLAGKHNEEGRSVSNLATAKSTCKRKKSQRLSCFAVSQIVVSKGIKTRTELLAHASVQKAEGKTDLAEFIVNRGSKVVEEVIATAWEMEGASEALARSRSSRLEILEKALQNPCNEQCNGRWLECAKQLLEWNDISKATFTLAIRNLLLQGRGKFRNVLLKGPANTGKTFLLNPLNVVYKAFTNPATSNFAWVGAEKAEVIFLNDFRWNPQIIQWHDLLLMLEGQPVHLPAPKSHFCKDLEFNSDTPIFCTTKHDLVYVKGGVIDERETEMMAVRWYSFQFRRQIAQRDQISVPPCARCFAELIDRKSVV